MSVSFQVQRQLLLNFYFSSGECLPKVEDCGRTGQLPPVRMCTREQLNMKPDSAGAASAIKTVGADGIFFEPVTSCCGAHFSV